MMKNVGAYITGIYPRSEELVQMTRDHDRKRVDDATLQKTYEEARKDFVTLQQQSDFDYINNGQLNWHDDFRPLTECYDGLSTSSLVRYFNNNTFYREPKFEGSPTLNEEKLSDYFQLITDKTIVTLPGIICLAKLSGESVEKSADLLTELGSTLVKQGFSNICFRDTWLGYYSSKVSADDVNDWGSVFNNTADKLHEVNDQVKVGIHIAFGSAEPYLSTLTSSLLDYIGIDFFHTDINQVSQHDWSNKELVAGCLDGRNSLIETDNLITDFASQLLKDVNLVRLSLTNATDLVFLPEVVANQKVNVLASVHEKLSEE